MSSVTSGGATRGRHTGEDEEFDLESLVDEVVSRTAPFAFGRGIELVAHVADGIPLAMRGDRRRLRWILFGMVSNAIRNTTGGEVVVRATAVIECNDAVMVRFDVEETENTAELGPSRGSSRLHADRGLDRIGACSAASSLAGLAGLAWHVEQHHEESGPGVGCRTWVTVPLARDRSEAPLHMLFDSAEADRLQGLRLLLVESNRSAACSIEAHLGRYGTRIQRARNGAEALDLAQAARAEGHLFDLVLVDVTRSLANNGDNNNDAAHVLISGLGQAVAGGVVLLHAPGETIDLEHLTCPWVRGSLVKPIGRRRLIDTLLRCRDWHEKQLSLIPAGSPAR